MGSDVFTALAYYIISGFLDPIQWLLCAIFGWRMEKPEHAAIASAAIVALLYMAMLYVYPEGKLFSYPTPHIGFAILGKAIGAALMAGLIHWLKKRQMNRKKER